MVSQLSDDLIFVIVINYYNLLSSIIIYIINYY